VILATVTGQVTLPFRLDWANRPGRRDQGANRHRQMPVGCRCRLCTGSRWSQPSRGAMSCAPAVLKVMVSSMQRRPGSGPIIGAGGILFARRYGARRAGRMSVSLRVSPIVVIADQTEYNEDTQCRICNSFLLEDRYKCVSCNKFDLCKSCESFPNCPPCEAEQKVTPKLKRYIRVMSSSRYLICCYRQSDLHLINSSVLVDRLLHVVSSDFYTHVRSSSSSYCATTSRCFLP
jgi:hypothetical protein